VIGLWFERCLPIAFQRACSDTIMTNSARRLISGDGLFSARFAALPLPREWGNRPIDVDSCRNRAKFESRKFPFEIKSEEI
jgi:hypothetical protein